jgi:hypothetical protein
MAWSKVIFFTGQIVTSNFLNTFQDSLISTQGDLAATNSTVAAQAASITSLGSSVTTINSTITTLQATDVDLQEQISAIDVTNPGAIAGLVDGGVTDNSATFNSFLTPIESGGSIITADGVLSSVPQSGDYAVAARIDADPQVSMYWWGRGAITLIPDARLPGIVPGTPGTGVRTGGGAPGSVVRIVRRSPQINKQAYQGVYGGWNIDMTGVLATKTFNCDASGVFSSNGHGRQNGDIIFFDSSPTTGAALPTPLVNGNLLLVELSYKVTNATTNTFKVNAYDALTKTWPTPVTTAAGSGVWSTNLSGVRIGNQKPAENPHDPDQDYDDNKEYTAGHFKDMDIVGMPGHGLICEDNNGRLAIDSARAMSNRLDGFHILSQDKVLYGHWGAGSNGKFGFYADTGTGVYAVTGNIWGNPGKRSKDCGAIWFDDVMYWALVANQPNDWMRFDGKGHFNASGAIVGNMIHPHGENYSSDGVGINVYGDGDLRLQAHVSVRGYQGVQFASNAFCRTEGVKSRFNTPGNFNGAKDGANGTAAQYLYHFDTLNGHPAMAQIIEGYCTAPDVKPWQGPFSTVTVTLANPAVITWTAHPLVVGDRVFFSTTGSLPSHIGNPLAPTSDTSYYVTSVPTADTFQVSATYGGTPVDTSADTQSGTHTCWQLSSSPYYITGSAQIAGVYVDSYRGVVNLWSKNGTAPKILVGINPNDSWEGNPNYQVELGDRRLVGGVPKHQRIYGACEFGYAPQLATDGINRVTVASGSKTIDPYRSQWAFNVSGGAIASATIVLPSSMTSSYELEVTFNGSITALGWTATLNSSSLPLPTYISGWTVIKLRYMADNNEWTVLSINGTRGWVALTDAASISTPAFPDASGRFSVTLGGNRTLSNPSGSKDGQRYTYRLTQDATGSRIITWGNKFVFPGSAATTVLSTAANAVDIVEGVYDALTNKIYCQLTKAYS